MPVIPEAAFLANEQTGTTFPRPEGTLIVRVSARRIKEKWGELIASCCRPVGLTKTIGPNSPDYVGLNAMYPDAPKVTKRYGGVPINCLLLSPVQMSYYYWVANGNMPESRFNVIKGVWSSGLFDKWAQAERDRGADQFYETDIVTIPGLRSDLGLDERGDADLIDTWVWGPGEKKDLFVTQIGNGSTDDVEDLVAYEDCLTFAGLAAAGISGPTVAELKNPNVEVPPRRNKRVPRGLLKKVGG